MSSFDKLYEVIKDRQANPAEGSYTCYLFEKGVDKILKKCGEECAEVIIAAKGGEKSELENEICDLIYHLFVLMADRGVALSDIERILDERAQKIGNLKTFNVVDKDS